MDFADVSHLLTLLGGGVLVLLLGIALPRRAQTWNALPAALVLLASAYLTHAKLALPPGEVLAGVYVVDPLALWSSLWLILAALLVLLLSLRTFRRDAREAEYYALLVFATLGGVLLVGALDLMQILLGVLLLSAASYPLLAFRRTQPAALEAALKFYLLGAMLNIGLLYGLVLLYGLSGSTLMPELAVLLNPDNERLTAVASVLVIAGLGGKAGYAPAHFWVPDAHQGATPPVAALLSLLPKLAALVALLRLVDALAAAGLDWTPLIAVIAAVTMTWGHLAALAQEDLPRLLGYAGMAQTGYLLMAVAVLPHPLAAPGLIFEFLAYLLATIAAFGVITASGCRTLSALRGLWASQPLLALTLLLALLSLIGVPPLAGFSGKLMLFTASFQSEHGWLLWVALGNTLLAGYVYLRPLRPMFAPVAERPAALLDRPARAVALAAALATVLIGVLALLYIGAGPGLPTG